MVNDRKVESTVPVPFQTRKRLSNAAKLVQAAVLAAVLVPLGSAATEASTCGFGTNESGCAVTVDGFTVFEFDDPTYKIGLQFDIVIGGFDVTIDDVAFSEAAMLARLVAFPGFTPVPIGSNPLAPFIEFQVSGEPTPCTTDEECANATNTWRSDPATRGPATEFGYDMRFYWLADTDALFPDPHVLHNTGEGDIFYDFDMTVAGSYSTFGHCDVFACIGSVDKAPGDPAVGGRDDMFNGFTLAAAPSSVPEPASLMLVGSGIGGLLYRRRHRNQ